MKRTSAGTQASPLDDRGWFLADDVSTYYAVTFDEDAAIDNLDYNGIDFLSGADCEGMAPYWYAVGYSGGLYELDKYTGTATYLAYTIPLNSLAYDTTTGIWYCCGYDSSYIDSLFTIDINTGATTFIGHFGTPNLMISLMCDTDGHLYSYDVLSGGDSHLYDINKTSGAATNPRDMGHNFCYAQEGKFSRSVGDSTLYLAAYDYGMAQSYLATCDPATGAVTILNLFDPMDEIDALCIPYYDDIWVDVGVKNIKVPVSGDAGIISPEITVKNYGNQDESFPTEVTISKKIYTDYLIEEFEGSFPPAGWTVETLSGGSWHRNDYWSPPRPNHAGIGLCADADVVMEQSAPMLTFLSTPSINLSTASNAVLDVDSYEYVSSNDLLLIDVTVDGGNNWTNLYKVASTNEDGTLTHVQENLSGYVGCSEVRLRFGYFAPSASDGYWEIDNVKIRSYTWDLEYDQQMFINLSHGSTVNLTFPAWTPADWLVNENVDFEYRCDAQTLLVDWNSYNDLKERMFTLHYGFFHDVAITGIPSPVSDLAQTQPVQVLLENHGQHDENLSVNVCIGTVSSTTILTEDFTNGVPPPGWSTDDPIHWISSYTTYAGGVAPEASFVWTPSETGEFHLATPALDTTGWTTALLKYKECVNDYNGDYTLKIQTSIDGGVTWDDAYTRAGGPYGPQTTQVSLGPENGVGSSTLMISWAFSGNSYNINYWYIDDIWLGQVAIMTEYNQTVTTSIGVGACANVTLPDWTPAEIPFAMTVDYLIDASVSMTTTDEYPSDNELTKLITLRYEHDVGVVGIPHPPLPLAKSVIWDNGPYTDFALSSQLDMAYPFNSQVADDFMVDEIAYVQEVLFVGMFWNGGEVNPIDLNIIFYADDGSGNMPTGAGMDDPTPTALFVELHTGVMGTYNGDSTYTYEIPLDTWFETEANTKYWFVAQFVGNYPPQWGICESTSQQLHDCMQGFPVIGYPYWSDNGFGDVSFRLMGGGPVPPCYPSGTYPVAALIKNFGAVYNESDIPVNAKITHLENDTVIYDYDAIAPGPLAPNQTTLVSFPNVTFYSSEVWEGEYTLEVQTMLPGDDHPNNDKKTRTFVIYYIWHDIETECDLGGTMGENGWFVSDVTVWLNATQWKLQPLGDDAAKPPSGINHTYYSFDDMTWYEYLGPFTVSTDGRFTIYYYSVDKCFPPCVEPVKSTSFGLDKTPPTINLTAIPLDHFKTRWRLIINASDNTSGLAKIEVYIDGALVGNLSGPPWEFEFEGDGKTALAIAYDNAGNSAVSNQVQTNELSVGNQPAVFNHVSVAPTTTPVAIFTQHMFQEKK